MRLQVSAIQRRSLLVTLWAVTACSPIVEPHPDAGTPVVPSAPMDVTAVAGDARATVSWLAPSTVGTSPITGYTITTIPGGATTSTSDLSTTLAGLTNGLAYTFTVHATSAAGSGPESLPSSPVTPTAAGTVPGAPTQVAAVAGDAQASVSWNAPASNGGSAITKYTVTTTPGGTTLVTAGTSLVVASLANGTAYTFRVHATNVVGDGPESIPSAPVIPMAAATVPGAPTNVVASADNAQATLTWTAPASSGGSEITGYTVTSMPGGLTLSTSGATTTTIHGLTNGTTYTFTVHATNVVGNSSESAASNAVTPATIPGAPTDVVAAAGDAQASVSWLPPSDNGGSVVLDYAVTIAPGGTTLTTSETSMAFTGLVNGTTYSFSVAARNAIGVSLAAASNAVTPVSPLTVPSAPLDVAAVRGNASATVSWSAPTSDGGTPITLYTVTATPGGATATTTGALSATVSGLANGTSYTFTVRATNVVGNGPPSAASATVMPATTPDAPTGVVAMPGNGSAVVSWTAPLNDGGSALIGYVVTVHPGEQEMSADTASVTISGLTNGTAYTFTVRAVNDVGDGADAEASIAVTPVTIPGAPTNVLAVAGEASALVTWTAPEETGGTPITGYVVQSSLGGVSLAVGAVTSASLTGLTNGASYSFSVHALNAVGDGPDSAPSNAVTPVVPQQLPGAPTNVVATAGARSATLTWTAPSSDGNSAIVGYVVTTSPGGATTTVTGLTTTIAGLASETTYTFTVRAQNGVGLGPESEPSNAIAPYGVPGAPTQVVAHAGFPSGVYWLPPDDDGGSAITSYTVTATPGGLTVTTTIPVAFFDTLEIGVSYTFTVHASNAAGDGAESDPSNSSNNATAPGAPTNLTVFPLNASVQVSWNAPDFYSGSPLTGFVVQVVSGDSFEVDATTTSFTVPNLTNGQPYQFVIYSVNAIGSTPSGRTNPVTPRTVPGAPTAVTAAPQDGAATVRWTAPASNGGSAITRYAVTASPGGATATTSSTSLSFDSLSDGTSYTFTVHATNEAGDGAESAPSNAVTPAHVPGAPTGASAVASSGRATIFWTAPASDGGSAITKYVVAASPGGQTVSTTGATSVAFTGLTNGTTYTFTVHAVNDIGAGPESAPTAPAYPGAHTPAAPTGITVASGYTAVLVSWTAPTDDGGAPIQNYYVAATPGPRFAITDGTTTSAAVTGLLNGTTYTFTVFAINAAGSGPTSSVSAAVTPGSTPGVPLNVSAVAGNQSVSLSWSPPASDGGSDIVSYTVTASPGGATFVTTEPRLSISGLTNGVAFTFTVHATTAVGDGPESAPSNAVTPAGPPGTPTILSVVPGDGQATVTFAPPADNGGSPITSYVVTASPGGANVTIPVSPGGASPNAGASADTFTGTVTGLQNGTAYTFSVIAVNALGAGSGTPPSDPATPGNAPGLPRNVLATPGSGQVTVSWSVPLSSGDAPISGYTVTSNPGALTATTTSATTVTMSGLTNGTAYSFAVVASNLYGSGPAATSNAVTPTSGLSTKPTNVVATGGGESFVVSWVAPTDPSVVYDHFRVIGDQSGYGQLESDVPANATSVTFESAAAIPTVFTVFTWNSTLDVATSTSDPSAKVTTDCLYDWGCSLYGDKTMCDSSAGVCVVPCQGGYGCDTCDPASGAPCWCDASGACLIDECKQTRNCLDYQDTRPLCDVSIRRCAQCLVDTDCGPSGLSGPYCMKNDTCQFCGSDADCSAARGGPHCGTAGACGSVSAPAAPTHVQAAAGTNQATLTWTAPTDNGGSAITGYTVTSSPGGLTVTTTGATTATITGLTAGTSYTFTVTATNAIGNSPSSAVSNAVTPTVPLLTRPTNVVVSVYAADMIHITWVAPTNPSIVNDHYMVWSSQDAANPVSVPATATSFNLSLRWTEATTVFVATWSDSLGHATSTSDASNSVTPPCLTGSCRNPATSFCNTGTGLCVAECANGSGCDSCSDPEGICGCTSAGACVTDECGNANGCLANHIARLCDRTTLTCVECFHDADCPSENGSGAPYCSGTTCAWCAGNADCSDARGGPYCAGDGLCYPAVAPAAPTNVQAAAGTNQATLTWTAPTDNGGSAVTGYTVTSSPGGLTATTTGATTATITGLTVYTGYTFKVTARNASGTSTASAPSSLTFTSPLPAQSLVATNTGSGEVTLSWTVDSDSAAFVVGFTIDDYYGEISASAGPSTRSIVLNGLLPHSNLFTVGSVFTNDITASSDVSNLITPICGAGLCGNLKACNQQTGLCEAACQNGLGCDGCGDDPYGYGCGCTTGGTCVLNQCALGCGTIDWMCDPATLSCVGCLTDLNCPDQYSPGHIFCAYSPGSASCIGCSNDAFCVEKGAGNSCDPYDDSCSFVPKEASPGGVTVVAGDGSATVSWQTPTWGGSPMLYTVIATPGGHSVSVTGTSQATVTGLLGGTAYTFLVVAQSPNGLGSSQSSPVTIPSGCPLDCNGTCVDPLGDVNNCGACGQTCSAASPFAASCSSGLCEIRDAVGANNTVADFTTDASNVYLALNSSTTPRGRVERVSLAGGAVTTLQSGPYTESSVAVSGSTLYWGDDVAMRSIPTAGGTSTTLAYNHPVSRVVIDANSIYFAESTLSPGIKKVARAGGALSTLATNVAGAPPNLMLDSSSVYYADYRDLYRVAKNGGTAAVKLYAGSGPLSRLALDATYIYWADGSNVLALPLAGGNLITVADGRPQPRDLVADGSQIYWLEGAWPLSNLIVSSIGGTPAVVATTANTNRSLRAIDATHFYWTDSNAFGWTLRSSP